MRTILGEFEVRTQKPEASKYNLQTALTCPDKLLVQNPFTFHEWTGNKNNIHVNTSDLYRDL